MGDQIAFETQVGPWNFTVPRSAEASNIFECTIEVPKKLDEPLFVEDVTVNDEHPEDGRFVAVASGEDAFRFAVHLTEDLPAECMIGLVFAHREYKLDFSSSDADDGMLDVRAMLGVAPDAKVALKAVRIDGKERARGSYCASIQRFSSS